MSTGYTIRNCRHVLGAVGQLHIDGFELLRAVPHFADSAGGGRWRCALVPAELTASDRGASLAEPSSFFGVEEIGYAWYPSPNLLELIDDVSSSRETARLILERYPRLAEDTRGRDAPYVRWYAEMLRLTEPEGLFVGSHWEDQFVAPPIDHLRVVGGTGAETTVVLPPSRPLSTQS